VTVFATCVEGHCVRGVELIPCEGPEERGWEYLGDTGWLCPEHAWIALVLPEGVEGPDSLPELRLRYRHGILRHPDDTFANPSTGEADEHGNCDLCGCDRINGFVPGQPCPDCDPCACGHSGGCHEQSDIPPQPCYVDGCACAGFHLPTQDPW
jgi:hypothetical protein